MSGACWKIESRRYWKGTKTMSHEPRRRDKLVMAMLDFAIRHLWLDILVVLVILAGWVFLVQPHIQVEDSIATALATGAVTLAGLVIAATTFVCTMVYTSENSALISARKKFGRVTSLNWRFILGAEFISGLGALTALIIIQVSPAIAVSTITAAVALLTVEFARTLIWLDATLFAEHRDRKAEPLKIARPRE